MLRFNTVTDEKECRGLWEAFSPKQILWDLWDFRYCFHTKNFSFNFIVGFDGKNKTGLLPLVFDNNEKYYTYFGEEFPEQNKFFLKVKKNLKAFLDNCPKDTEIYYISAEEAEYYDFKPGDKRYFLDLGKYGNTFEGYLKSFTRKHRKNLTYDLRKLKEKNYTVEKNKAEDFDKLIDLNKKRFGPESSYVDSEFAGAIRNLMETADKENILDMLSIKFSGATEAVGLGVFYNNVYYVIGMGRNIEIKNLGKLLIAEQIKSAIGLKCNEVDFLSTEANWKELWNLDLEQMYKFEK